MTDNIQVSGAFDRESYDAGDQIVGTITGTNEHTEDVVTTTTVGPVDVPVVSRPSGAQSVISFHGVTVTHTDTVTTVEDMVIDLSRPIVDNGPNPHTWVVSGDLKFISTVA